MPQLCEFDIDAAVAAAIEVFRAYGCHGTSVQDLTEGAGLARGSLYKAFHDKRSLFLSALDHYTGASLQRVGDPWRSRAPRARRSARRRWAAPDAPRRRRAGRAA